MGGLAGLALYRNETFEDAQTCYVKFAFPTKCMNGFSKMYVMLT